MYEGTEAIIRLSSGGVQQALAIWLDKDGEQAIQFIKQKIVNKTNGVACKRSANPVRRIAPCQLGKCNSLCCVGKGMGVLQGCRVRTNPPC